MARKYLASYFQRFQPCGASSDARTPKAVVAVQTREHQRELGTSRPPATHHIAVPLLDTGAGGRLLESSGDDQQEPQPASLLDIVPTTVYNTSLHTFIAGTRRGASPNRSKRVVAVSLLAQCGSDLFPVVPAPSVIASSHGAKKGMTLLQIAKSLKDSRS